MRTYVDHTSGESGAGTIVSPGAGTWSHRLDDWIHGSFRPSARGLGLFRILYASYALLVIAPGHDVYASLTPVASLPGSMFVPPPGPMMLFHGFPGPYVAEAIHAMLAFGLAAVLVGYRTKLSSLLVGMLFLLVYGFSYSLGKVNHNMLFILLPMVMAGSNWGAALSYDATFRASTDTRVHGWPIVLVGLLLGFAMFTAGFAKLLGGWLDPSTQATYGHLANQMFVRGRTDLLAPFLIGFDNATFWEIADYGTVLFELGFLLAVLHPVALRLFAALAVLFHFGIMTSLNIAFAFNLVVYAAFVDWRRPAGVVVNACRRVTGRVRTETLRAGLIGLMVAGAVYFHLIGSPLLWLDEHVPLESDLTAREVLVVTAAAGLVVVLGMRIAVRFVSNRLSFGVRFRESL